jgi:hypothetical protein
MYHVLEDLRANRRIITYLKWIFEKYVVRMLNGLNWLRITSDGGIL